MTAEVIRATTPVRYIRITALSVYSGSIIDLSEVEIVDADGFALDESGRTASTTSTTADPSLAIDGTAGTSFVTSGAEPFPHNLSIDLGAENVVSMVRFRQLDSNARIENIQIETSLDGVLWTTVALEEINNVDSTIVTFDEVMIELTSEQPIVLGGTQPTDAFTGGVLRDSLEGDPLDLGAIEDAITNLSLQLAEVGAQLTQHEFVTSRLTDQSAQSAAVRDGIQGADFGRESRDFAQSQILEELAAVYQGEAQQSLRTVMNILL